MPNVVGAVWLELEKELYSISVQRVRRGHKTKYHYRLVNYHHYDLLIHFCGFKSASWSSWWNFQWTFI